MGWQNFATVVRYCRRGEGRFAESSFRDGPPRINTFPALAEAAMAAVAFRDDLARFPVIGSTRREHIERWMEDPRVQEVWEKLAATAPDLEPKAFIHFVLMLRQGVSDASAQRYYIEKCNTWRAKYNKVLKRLVSAGAVFLSSSAGIVRSQKGSLRSASVATCMKPYKAVGQHILYFRKLWVQENAEY